MGGTRQQDARVDELRQRLRSLGYLDAGVDRFVLAPAHGGRGPAAIALLASLRIGLLGAILLGPATVIGIGARLSGLVTGPRDAVVLAAYMGVLLGAAIAGAAFLASLAVAWFARRAAGLVERRGRALAVAAGAAVAVLTLAYLTLWWRTAGAGPAWASPMWTAFALAVAAAISVLLGHAVTVTALAVIAAGTGPAIRVRGVPGASWGWSLAAALAAFGGAALLLVLSAPSGTRAADAPPLTVISSGIRVRVLAIDGFDPSIYEQLAAAGRVPSLAAVFDGARASLDRGSASPAADEAFDPARAWTTVATGQPPGRHGVQGLETRRLPGIRGAVTVAGRSPLVETVRAATDLLRLTRPSTASGAERQEKTFWEVAAGAGLRTAVVNWWATWPAATGAGIVLTDRATLRLERGGDLHAEIAPTALYPDLRQQWPRIVDEASSLAGHALAGAGGDTDIDALLRRSARLDAMQLVLASRVADANTDLVAIYLPGLDIVQHALLGGGSAPVAASSIAARLEAVRMYYEALDRLVGPMLSSTEGVLVLAITAPGRVTAGTKGLLAAAGANAGGPVRLDASTTDVAPTILYALGVPISRALEGEPLTDLLSSAFESRYPMRMVDTYGPPSASAPVREGQPLDEEMIERLRSLGYVR